MTMLRLAAALVFAASPAAAARLCGSVNVLGRPLPSGFVTLAADAGSRKPGKTERTLARFGRDGFCLENVEKGDYLLSVSPVSLWQTLALRGAGLAEEGDAVKVRVDGSDARLSLEWRTPAPPAEWATLDLRVRFPAVGGPDLSAEPALVVAHMRESGMHFAWLDAAPRGEAVTRLRVGPGSVVNLLAYRSGWGVGGLEPSYVQRSSDALILRPAQLAELTLLMARAGRIAGRAVLPDGKPFAPYLGSKAQRRRVFGVYLAALYANREYYVFADENGRYDFEALPAGDWEVLPTVRGPGFPWAVEQARLISVKEGESLELEHRLADAAPVTVAAPSVTAAPLWQTSYSTYNPTSRWVLGMPEGAFTPDTTFRYLLEDADPIAFLQQAGNRWMPAVGDDQDRGKVKPGRYDIFLTESRRWLSFTWTKILAARPGVDVPRSGVALAFAPEHFLPRGSCELRGRVRAAMKWTLADLRRETDLARWHMMISPVVNVFEESGRLAAVGMLGLTMKDYDAFGAAVRRNDEPAVRRLLYGAPREFSVKGLAPGKYRAQLAVWGYPPQEAVAVLSEGAPTRLEFALEGAPKGRGR